MRILFIGDIVGKPGYTMVCNNLNAIRTRHNIDVVIANAENSADGSGLTPQIYEKLVAAGIDAITLGDHIYRRKEIYTTLESQSNIVKPANFPEDAPGKKLAIIGEAAGEQIAIISLIGRVFMKPVDCPFKAADKILSQIPSTVRVILIDFHAEATSDKQLMGRYLDGRVTAVLGTHTHVPTADECILPGGTAFQCDVGMTGPYESILGRKISAVTEATTTFRPTQFRVATEDVRMGGAILDVNIHTGKAKSIERICIRADQF
ncbi:MAG: TIGR00282 family metallophosphoesterase [Planctomycetaceae bacterium]|nr:TIGR00282 family metallophosphoesterase [Planctomycetaceae bacterium]